MENGPLSLMLTAAKYASSTALLVLLTLTYTHAASLVFCPTALHPLAPYVNLWLAILTAPAWAHTEI